MSHESQCRNAKAGLERALLDRMGKRREKNGGDGGREGTRKESTAWALKTT